MVLQTLRRWLQQPYPFTNNWRSALVSAVVTGIFVAGFLYFFRPFGTKVSPDAELRFIQTCGFFGLVTVVVTLLVNALTRVLPKIFEEERWVVGKEIAFNLFFVGCIGFGNLLLAHFLWQVPLVGKAFWIWQGLTFAVGIFPIVVGALIGQMKGSRKYTAEAAQIVPKPHLQHDEQAIWVLLEGENQNEQLRLHPGQIVYIAAADNYVQVYFLENDTLKKRLLRATLKKMEDAVAEHTFLFRCHRTFLVNMDMVQKVSGNAQGYRLHLLHTEETIPVSRNLNAVVQKML